MKDITITTPIKAVGYTELDEVDRRLVDAARGASGRTYSPYSHFGVGAAILLSNGDIVTGSNQENAAFPSSMCAERTAAYYAHASHPDARFERIAIAARGTDGREVAEPVSPCGACRQALLEYEHLGAADVKVLLVGRDDIFILPSVRSLLPLSFTEF